MRRLSIILTALSLASCLAQPKQSDDDSFKSAGTFTQLSSMSQERTNHVSESVNGKLYAIGGVVHGPTFLSSVEEYDPATDTWSSKSSMTAGRQGMGSATYGNKIYVFGGYAAGGNTTRVEEYDPALDTWTTKTAMPVAAQKVTAVTVGSLIYVFPYILFANAYVYDPVLDSWTTLATDGVIGMQGHPVAVGTDIYFVGRDTIPIYDTANDSWSEITSPGDAFVGNYGQRAVLVGSKIVLFDQSFGWTNEMEIFDPSTQKAERGYFLGVVHSLGAAAVINNEVYLTGGADSNAVNTATLHKFTP
jgi:N-acetylneuraminic acid mutarotase